MIYNSGNYFNSSWHIEQKVSLFTGGRKEVSVFALRNFLYYQMDLCIPSMCIHSWPILLMKKTKWSEKIGNKFILSMKITDNQRAFFSWKKWILPRGLCELYYWIPSPNMFVHLFLLSNISSQLCYRYMMYIVVPAANSPRSALENFEQIMYSMDMNLNIQCSRNYIAHANICVHWIPTLILG